jgi:hypothetical protein
LNLEPRAMARRLNVLDDWNYWNDWNGWNAAAKPGY